MKKEAVAVKEKLLNLKIQKLLEPESGNTQ